MRFEGKKAGEIAAKMPFLGKKFLLFNSKMKYLILETESKSFSAKSQKFLKVLPLFFKNRTEGTDSYKKSGGFLKGRKSHKVLRRHRQCRRHKGDDELVELKLVMGTALKENRRGDVEKSARDQAVKKSDAFIGKGPLTDKKSAGKHAQWRRQSENSQ